MSAIDANVKSPTRPSGRSFLMIGLWLVVAFFYAYHFFQVWQNAVDIPFIDEWDEFPKRPLVNWVFATHNEHRIVTTKLVILALWQLNGWNFVTHQILNFLMYGGLVFCLARFLAQSVPDLPSPVLPVLCLWVLSPMNFENHSWGFQTQWHLTVILILASVYFLFNTKGGHRPNQRSLGLGIFAALTCTLSLSAGVPAMAAVTLCYFARTLRWPTVSERNSFLLAGLILIIVVAWLPILDHAQGIPLRTQPPSTWLFWAHFFTMMGMGVGYTFPPPVYIYLGAAFFAAALFPWVLLLGRRHSPVPASSGQWAVGAGTAAILAALLSISLGRAYMGADQPLYSQRYSEFTLVLLPLTVAAWWLALQNQPRIRLIVLLAIALVFGGGFTQSLGKFKAYAFFGAIRSQAREEVLTAYAQHKSVLVPDLHPYPITYRHLQEARDLNLSFLRNAKN